MPTIVTINSNPATTVSLKPANKTFASVSVAPSANISVGSLTDVSIANISDGQTVVYNSTTSIFEGSSPTVTLITGGKF